MGAAGHVSGREGGSRTCEWEGRGQQDMLVGVGGGRRGMGKEEREGGGGRKRGRSGGRSQSGRK